MSHTPKAAGGLAAKGSDNSVPLRLYATVFGLFLGLCIWKFGNPVILDNKIPVPVTAQEFLNEPWPIHWVNWLWPPLAAIGALLALQNRNSFGATRWLWLLPLAWLGWQWIAATQTVRPDLTASTLWQFSGCVACYFLGALVFARERSWRWLLIGVLAAFTFCLVRAVDQRLFEFPTTYQSLVEGQQNGWTNYPAAMVEEMRNDKVIITTNGVEMANPVILTKFAKARVSGTLVYPNALAQLVLLLWPVALVLAFGATRALRPLVRWAAIITTVSLGASAFFWTGSKLGWLIGIALVGVILLRLKGSKTLKLVAIVAVLVLGLGVFAVRFHHYFTAGATSVGARFDYWRAAVQTCLAHPIVGTGPGTFQEPYSCLKAPESEMARLAHNDFLEQFSDSGIPGGVTYAAWIVLAMVAVGRGIWQMTNGPGGAGSRVPADPAWPPNYTLAVFLGLLGWFLQGLGEFGLFIPALAWVAFTLLGTVIGAKSV